MNTVRAENLPDKPYFMATMFNPAVVWDISRLAIAEKMTDSERRAIAKRSTGILRDKMPEITGALNAYDTTRSRFAQAVILRQIGNAGLLKKPEYDRNEKIYTRSEKVLQSIDSITETYRYQAGYRATCLSFLMTHADRRQQALSALDDLQQLWSLQQIFFQALLLNDLLHWCKQYSPSYPDFDVESASAPHVKKLRSRISTLDKSMKVIKTTLLGPTVETHFQNERLNNPLLNGTDMRNPEKSVTTEFLLMQKTFNALNEGLSLEVALKMDDTILESADWDFNLMDAK